MSLEFVAMLMIKGDATLGRGYKAKAPTAKKEKKMLIQSNMIKLNGMIT
jgi:hypothetical protein